MNPPPLRLVLTVEQSAAIRESGIRFAIIHPGSYPATPGRWVADLFEIDQATAAGAVNVALGTHTAVRRRQAHQASTRPAAGISRSAEHCPHEHAE